MTTAFGRTPGTLENGVIFGHDDHLFLASGGHHAIEVATGQMAVPARSYEALKVNLAQRSRTAEAMGVPYAHVIVPDKHTVLSESFPSEIKFYLAREHIAQNPGIRIFYPEGILRGLGKDAFKRTDTHLSGAGAAIVAVELANELLKAPGEHSEAELYAELRPQVEIGDLGSRFSPPLSYSEARVVPLWRRAAFSFSPFGNNGIVDIYINKNAPHRAQLMMFGDSFGRSISEMCSRFFSEVIFLRTQFFYPEIVSLARPDFVVTQMVERYLFDVVPDDHRPLFFSHHTKGSTKGSEADVEAFSTAFSALLSFPRKPYQDFIKAHGEPREMPGR